MARRTGHGKKGYWLTQWGLKASQRGDAMPEILKTIKRMRQKTVAEIQAWISKDLAKNSQTDSMWDLMDSLENAKDVLKVSLDEAKERQLTADERRLWSALGRFIEEWRQISLDVCHRMGLS